MRHVFVPSLLVPLILLYGPWGATFAQVTGASINGMTTDPSGAAIAGAHITVQNTSTGLTQSAESNSSGLYSVAPLPPGQYQVTTEHVGFLRAVQGGITLTVAQAATINVVLQVGSQQQTVTVTAQSPLVNVTSASVSDVVDEHAIKELPLNGRNPASLVLLSSGTTNTLVLGNGIQTTDSFPNETGASADGGRLGSTYYFLDGVPNMDPYMLLAAPFPNADATQEFRVVTNNFEAQYGFSPDAVVSINTKSGTNAFHVGLFEFVRNNDLNASNFFTHLVDPLKRNQFGGYVGGPIKKDKLFFFVNYQETLENTTSSTNTTFTPTAAMLRGDFSAVPKALKGPFATVNGKPNQVDPALFSPGAVQIAETTVPLGQNPATGQVNYTGAPSADSFKENTARLDYTISNTQRVFARSFIQYYDVPASLVNGDMLATVQRTQGKYFNEVINHTWTVSPTFVNQLSASWVRMDLYAGNQMLDGAGKPICLSRYVNVGDPPDGCYLEGLTITNGFTAPYAEPNGNVRTTWWLSDSAMKTFGNHLLTVGFDLAHQWGDTLTDFPAQPVVTFTGYATGFGLADFLLGDVASFVQGTARNSAVKGWQIGVFAQDQYKFRPNLTLTAGLRWDPFLAPLAVDGGAAFVAGQQSARYPTAPTGVIFPGDPGLNANLMPTSYAYYEPRVGVAWQPHSLPRTALRAGFGMFTGPLYYREYNQTAGMPPFAPGYTLNETAAQPISFQNPWASFAATGGKSPFPPFAQNPNVPASQAIFLTPMSVPGSFSRDFRNGVTQNWSASIEQQLANNWALHLAYVGSESYHLIIRTDLNPGIYSAGGARATYPLFSTIIEDQSFGTASYQSFQAGLEKHLSSGLQFQSHFTWSKALDLAANHPGPTGELGDPFNMKWNYGISDYNVPLISVTNLVYRTPSLKGQPGIIKQTLGAWELSGIWTMQSGRAFGINGGSGANNSEAQQSLDRANLTGQPFDVHSGSEAQWLQHYFNAAAFVPNPAGTFGTSGKNILQGPGIANADIALIKNWQVMERYGLQFRWEMFNAFNRPTFGLPVANPAASNFGQITGIGAIPPRVMQGAIKFSF
jgi:hypothetical protein